MVPAGLLEPLPSRATLGKHLNGFHHGLTQVRGVQHYYVVVDRFSKYGIFIPALAKCPAEVAAPLFLKHVVKY